MKRQKGISKPVIIFAVLSGLALGMCFISALFGVNYKDYYIFGISAPHAVVGAFFFTGVIIMWSLNTLRDE